MSTGAKGPDAPLPDSDTIGPSWLYNGFMASGCLIMAVALFQADSEIVGDGVYISFFLLFAAAVLLLSHAPGSTGVWLDRDGFLMREMYSSRRYEWDQVGRFEVRRKLLGKAIDFAVLSSDSGMAEVRSLPRGVGGSVWDVAKKMNEWRDRAVGEA